MSLLLISLYVIYSNGKRQEIVRITICSYKKAKNDEVTSQCVNLLSTQGPPWAFWSNITNSSQIKVWALKEPAIHTCTHQILSRRVPPPGLSQFWPGILKNYNCLDNKKRFQNANIHPCITPRIYYKDLPLPPRKIWRKSPLTKNKPRGLLSEFYGI